MTNYILNSSIIPNEGIYKYKITDDLEAKKLLSFENNWISAIGYQETVDAFNQLYAVNITVNRTQIKFDAGDKAIVFKLTKRVDPQTKGGIGLDFILNNYETGLLERIE